MNATASKLSDPKYGFDVVVAMTQKSINTTLKFYLGTYAAEPLVTQCWVRTADGTGVQEIAYADLLARTNGLDPFKVPATANPATDKNIATLEKAGFVAGFQARLGLPPMTDTRKTPDIVVLGNDASRVTYNLMCSTFEAVQLDAAANTWFSMKQPTDAPWIFTTQVDLRLEDVPAAKYPELPPTVQQQIKNLSGTAFGVQQLLFDLDNATLQTAPPQMSDIPPGPLTKILQTYFIDWYVAELKQTSSPTLSIQLIDRTTDASTLEITDLTMSVSANADTDVSTLNYLCATGDRPMPASTAPFAWSWVDPAEATDESGVVAVNCQQFIELLQAQLTPYVMANCYHPSVTVGKSGGQPTYDLRLDPTGTPQVAAGMMKVRFPGPMEDDFGATPPILRTLMFSFQDHAYDESGLNGDIGKASLDVDYLVTVYLYANTIAIDQLLTVDLMVEKNLQRDTGQPVNVRRVDVCELTVDGFGRLVPKMSTKIKPVNNPTNTSISGFVDFFLHLNEKFSSEAQLVSRLTGATLSMLPFTTAQYFVFPGGESFGFSNFAFSTGGDLVARLTYTDPQQKPPTLPPPFGRAPAGTDRLVAGQWLAGDQFLLSANGAYAAVMQASDGNFVLYHAKNNAPDFSRPYWSAFVGLKDHTTSPIVGAPRPVYALLQADGNFVIGNTAAHGIGPIGAGLPCMTTGSAQDELGAFTAVMQTDGNFVVYKDPPTRESAVFATNTWNVGG